MLWKLRQGYNFSTQDKVYSECRESAFCDAIRRCTDNSRLSWTILCNSFALRWRVKQSNERSRTCLERSLFFQCSVKSDASPLKRHPTCKQGEETRLGACTFPTLMHARARVQRSLKMWPLPKSFLDARPCVRLSSQQWVTTSRVPSKMLQWYQGGILFPWSHFIAVFSYFNDWSPLS